MDYEDIASECLHKMHKFHGLRHNLIDKSFKGESFVLRYIVKRGENVLPGEISTEMGITSARIAATLNSLEKKGFITRRIDTGDRRQIIVDSTELGVEASKESERKVFVHCRKMLEFLGEDDAKEFVRILGRIMEFSAKYQFNMDECESENL